MSWPLLVEILIVTVTEYFADISGVEGKLYSRSRASQID